VSSDIYELNCPFCDKLYKLPREKVIKHVGKSIHCRKCGQPFSIPALPPEEPDEITPPPGEVFPEQPPAATEPVIAHESEPIAVAEPEPSASEPAEEYSIATPFASGDSFEPPALEEYAQPPIVDFAIEPAADDLHEHDEAAFTAPIGDIVDAPESASYFASESLVEATIPLERNEPTTIAIADEVSAEESAPAAEFGSIEPEHPLESQPHESVHEFAMADESVERPELPAELPEALAAETQPIEAPPPQLPPVPVSAPVPPKPRRGARTAVAPVFDAESEEPQPRRRGMFASRAEQAAPIETIPTDPAAAGESPVFEAIHEEVAVESEPSPAARSTEPETAMSAPKFAVGEAVPIAINPAIAPTQISPQILDVWSSVRRALMLLATMSVIIAIVLVAILLTLLGIIPKK
jgi:hypothetical protein